LGNKIFIQEVQGKIDANLLQEHTVMVIMLWETFFLAIAKKVENFVQKVVL